MKKLLTINDEADDDDTVFRMIKDLCSEDVINTLMDVAGGTRISIPSVKSFSETSEISRRLGYDVAKEIVSAVGVYEISTRIHVPSRTKYMLEHLCRQDGLSANYIAWKTGVTMRSVYRARAALRKRGIKTGTPCRRRSIRHGGDFEGIPGVDVVRQLLLEGRSPSLLRDIMNIPPDVISWVRADLLKQGKLK